LLEGPSETPYEGGWYWGRLKFPRDYPFAPPSILMVTPSGRFETNTRLCLSMSDYHPESWQPAWSLATVLKGLLSFMCEECPTAGAVDPPPSSEERIRLARCSEAWNKANSDFMKSFPEFDRIVTEAKARRPHSFSRSPQAAVTSPDGADDGRPAGPIASQGASAGTAGEAEAGDRISPSVEPGTGLEAYVPGDLVRLHGLKARDDLNGRTGVVEPAHADTVAAGRIRVLVETPQGRESVGVKPDNVERMSEASRTEERL